MRRRKTKLERDREMSKCLAKIHQVSGYRIVTRLINKPSSSMPFNALHARRLGLSKVRLRLAYRRWRERSRSAYRLYWYIHPEQRATKHTTC